MWLCVRVTGEGWRDGLPGPSQISLSVGTIEAVGVYPIGRTSPFGAV